MAIRRYKKISELDPITSASLSTYVAGVDNGETVRITLDVLADGVRNTINTLDIQRLNALEAATSSYITSLNGTVSGSSQLTSSYDERYTLSGSVQNTVLPNGLISSSTQISNFGFISNSVDISFLNSYTSSQDSLNTAFTNGINARVQTSTYQTDSASFDARILAATNEQDLSYLVTTSSFNSYTASISTASLVDRLNAIESISGSWITESETGSYLTSLNGAISASSQLTASYDERYILSGSITQTTWDNIASKPTDIISSSQQITAYGFVSGSYETTGRNILSGSISYNNLTDIPSGIVSGTSQITTLLPSGIISGSSQILDGSDIISSSTQITAFGFVSGSYETTGRGIVSGSSQIIPLLPTGVISGSSQVISTATYDTIYAGETIVKGTPLYVSGSQGANPIVWIADAGDPNKMPVTYISNDNITAGNTGEGIILGHIEGVNTTGYSEGLAIYVAEGGGWTNDRPSGSSSIVQLLGIVTKEGNGGKGLVLNPGPATLPNLQSGYAWVGNVNNQPIAVATSSFASVSDLTALNAFTSSYNTDSASFDSRISSFASSGVPAGTISGSSQLTASYDLRYTLSGSVQPLPDGLVSSSAQITAFGFISESVDLTSLNNFTASISTASLVISIDNLNAFTASISTASLVDRLNNLESNTGSYETTGRGIISESVVTISDTQPSTGIGNLWYDSNGGNLYLHYDTNTWVDTSNGVIQTILTDGSLLSTASFNSWTASFTASVPAGTISSSAQISSFGFVSGSYETTGRGIISSSTQISDLGFVTSGGNVTFDSVTANQYIVSSSVYYVTQSYSSGSTIFGNTSDDIHQFTGSVSISGSVTITGSLNIANGASLGARLWQLSDVNDNITSSTDGYLLTYNSGSNSWYSAPGAGLKGTVRLYIATNRSNASGFYFNANTRTASDSASPTADTAFMVTTNLLNRVTVYLRQDNAGPNSVLVGVAKNVDGSAFSSATLITSSSLNLSANTTATYQFSGLTINTFDTLHIYCDPTNTPGTLYGIVIID